MEIRHDEGVVTLKYACDIEVVALGLHPVGSKEAEFTVSVGMNSGSHFVLIYKKLEDAEATYQLLRSKVG